MFLVQDNDLTINEVANTTQLRAILISILKADYIKLTRKHAYNKAHVVVSTLCEIANDNIGIMRMQNMLKQYDIYIVPLAKLQHAISNFEAYLKNNGEDIEDCERVLKQIEKEMEIKER